MAIAASVIRMVVQYPGCVQVFDLLSKYQDISNCSSEVTLSRDIEAMFALVMKKDFWLLLLLLLVELDVDVYIIRRCIQYHPQFISYCDDGG